MVACDQIEVGVGDALSDSMQCLNFAEKWYNSNCLTQNSIQTIIWFKINSADSIQKIIQYNFFSDIQFKKNFNNLFSR